MPVTLESNRILIDTVEVETVKTHVPEVDIDIDIVPVITNNEGDPAFELLTYTHSGGSEDQTEFNLTINEDTTCDILIVGGGGGGGRWRAGGGGGDVLYFENITLNGTYNINVGKGGSVPRSTSSVHHYGGFSGETSYITGGDSSYILNVNAGGGGGAGGWTLDALPGVSVSYTNPLTGNTETSSGGGAGTAKSSQTPSSGNSVSGNGGQGDYDGNDNSADDGAGGGGGGGGTNGHGGIPSGETGGLGGDGETIDITGNSIMYGKGGNGWGTNDPLPTTTPPNIGQGGAGANYSGGAYNHMAGGSGIVIIRKYLTPSALYEAQTTVTQYPVLPADSTNLVAWYKFDGDFTDSSGNGNDLDLTEDSQPITYSTGIINDAVNLDGIGTNGNGTYFKTPASFNAYNVWNGNGITLSGWFKPSSTSNSSSNIFAIYESNTYRINLVRRGTGSTFYIIEYLSTSNRNTYDAAISYPDFYDDKWHHLVLTIDKDIDENNRSITKIYLDAILIETFNSEFRNNLTKILLGASPSSVDGDTGNRYYKELIDDFRIYDKALSAYEIDILANNKIENPDYKILTFEYHGPSYPVIDADAASLVAHYKFDSGEELTDSVGNSVLTIYNGTSDYQNGKINESLNITDSGYKITSTTLVNLFEDVSSYWSVSFWYDKSTSTIPNKSPFISRYDDGGVSPRGGFEISINTNGTFLMERLLTSGAWITATTTYQAVQNQWVNIVYTCQPNLIRIYVDGILNVEETTNLSYASTSASHNELIGFGLRLRSNIVAVYTSGHGYLEDFRIYNKALSATEISDLYNQYNQTSYTVNFQAESECDILIVGGGGSGGGTSGDGGNENGGGGGGGVLYMVNKKLNGEYKFIVGNGGINSGYDGSDSKIIKNDQVVSYDSIQLIGYGGGGGGSGNTHSQGIYGRPGGSAGGDNLATYLHSSYSATATQGNTIWNGTSYIAGGYVGNKGMIGGSHGNTGGGGGGAGGSPIGVNNGGIGVEIDITGVPTYYAGGGGSAGSGVDGVGGLGGGGDPNASSTDSSLPENGESHTGGGGGGAYTNTTLKKKGGNGGSGIVIIRYYTKYIRQHPAYDAQWTYHSTNPNVHHYGNVGIGTLASETNKLTIKGDMNMIGNYKQNDVNLGNWYSSDNIHNIHRLTGNVGIGTTDPQYSVDTTGVLYASHGGFTGGTSTNWATSSDERIKDNITSASNETCYENVKNINLYKFNYKEQFANNKNETQYGFIAQEVQKYYPKAVKYEKIKVKDDTYENFLTINQTQLNYTLFGAVKHLQLELENIKVKLGMTVPVTEEPAVEETNTTEEPVAEETNTTEEPAVEETNTTEEPVAEETNTTEEPVAEETNTTEEPVTEETNTN